MPRPMEDPSPPGQLYGEASPVLHGVLESRQAATEGPVPDRWGIWVSAFVPLVDPRTGDLVTVLGIDIEAGTWRAKTWRAGLVPVLLSFLLVAILVAGYALRGRRDSASGKIKRRWNRLEAFLAAATGLVLTLAGFWHARSLETLHQQEAFQSLAHLKSSHVLNAIRNIRNSEVEGLGRFFESSDHVDPSEFRSYADYLNRIPDVRLWGWVPAVGATEREDFEQRARATVDPHYRLWETDADGQAIPAQFRDRHYPLFYLDPPEIEGLQGMALGHDLASIESLASQLERAALNGMTTATDAMGLSNQKETKPHILVFRPVRNGPAKSRLAGFVLAVLKPDHLMRTVLSANLDRNPHIHMELLELRKDAPPVRLASTFPDGTRPPPSPAPLLRPILAFGQTYAVATYPTPEFLAQHATQLAWLVLLAGLSITVAGTILISFIAHRREDMERLVDERTFELASSMRRYDQLSRHSRTITWEHDADGLYTHLSEVAEDVWGYSTEELVGKMRFFDLHPDAGREAYQAQMREWAERQQPFLNLVNPVVSKSGAIVWMSSTGMPILDDNGRLQGYQGTATDITARKHAEDELARLAAANQDAAERYATLISASNTGAWEYNDQTAHLWASPEYFAMLGRDPADFPLAEDEPNIEATWLDLIHPDDKEGARRTFTSYLQHPDGMYQQSFRMRHADGHWVWILSRGRILRNEAGLPSATVVGTHIDISEAKRAEQALRESEQKFRMLTENMKDVVWTLDTATGRFLYISPAVEKLLGRSRTDVMAQPLAAILVPAQRQPLVALVETRAAELRAGQLTSDDFFINEVDHLRADGGLVHTEVITRYGLNEHTGTVELHGVTRDITDRKRADRFREMSIQTLQILNEPDDLQDLLERLATMFKVNTGFDAIGIRLQTGGQFPYVVQQGLSCAFLCQVDDREISRLDADGHLTLQCACGLVLAGNTDPDHALFTSGGSCWTNDADRQFNQLHGEPGANPCAREGFASIALVPIRTQDRIVGLLQFNDRRKDQFSIEIIHILEGIAAHVGEAILRKRAEQDYRTLFHEMLEGFAVHEIICDDQGRPVDYRFLAVNPAFEAMTGLRAEHIVGKTVLEVLPQTESHWIDHFGHVAMTGTPAFFEQYAAALGKHFEVTAFRPAPNQFACIFSDVTKRKRSEEELRESRRQYAALLANLPGMAYRCANDRSWTMDFVSEGCRELTGYAPEDLVGNRTVSFNELIAPHHRRRLWDEWQVELREHRKFEDEYEITTRTGETKWVWEQGEGVYGDDGQVLAIEGFIADITERKRADTERDRLMAAIEQSGDTILITDPGGTILYVNPAFERVTGYTRADALGQNPRLLQSGQHDRNFYRKMWQTLSAGRVWQGQIVNRRKDGTPYTELASISPVRDATGRIVHFVAVKRDITQQLRDQEEKENLQAQLLQSQKMESIGRLAGGIAHDFNNMLQAILGYAEMGLESVPADQPLHNDLHEIQKAARRSAALTRQLQAFARKQTASPKVLDLNAALDGMTGMLRPLIGEGIQLDLQPAPDLGRVRVDPGHLDQLVTNLCINARDAITGTGRIAIETRNLDVQHPIRNLHGDIPPGSYVQLSVSDNGCGMAPEVLDHIFEPFFTTKNVGKGTGLGLATVYGLIQQNRGIPRVLSQPGKGTTFQIFFPRLAAGTPTAAPDEETPAGLAALRGTETILIVEDEEALLQTARRMLESLGYTVKATTSPEEALRIVEQDPDGFDLLLSDVIMHELNGPALVQRILKWRPNLTYLYMSGYTANLIADQGIKETSVNFLHKPFSRNQLAGKVRRVLDGN
jgi:PAS domain S-box-containing protein